MKGFLCFLYKETVQFLRNRGLLLFVIYAFTVDIYIASVSLDFSLRNATFYVQDHDNSYLSRELVSRFREPFFSFKGYVMEDELIDELLLRGEALGVIRIPEGFERDVKEGKEASVGIVVNGSEPFASSLFASYSARIVSEFLSEVKGSKGKGVEVEVRYLFNEGAESKHFMSISELLTVLTLFLIVLPATAVMREKEAGTLEFVMMSPVSTHLFFLAKSVAMTLVVLLFTLASLLLVIRGFLGVPFMGSYLTFLLVTSVYSFAITGLGMFVATLAKNTLQVVQITMLVLIPMLYLSGTWTPVESMPSFLRFLSLFMPLRFYIESAFGIVFKGLGVSELLPQIAVLLLFGTLMFVGGNLLISKRGTIN